MSGLDDDLIEVIAQEALVDKAKLNRGATLADVGIDSVDIVTVVFAVEEKYAVEIPENAFADVGDLGGFIDVLKGVIEKKAAA